MVYMRIVVRVICRLTSVRRAFVPRMTCFFSMDGVRVSACLMLTVIRLVYVTRMGLCVLLMLMALRMRLISLGAVHLLVFHVGHRQTLSLDD
jgi:hypothetical protein